MDTKYKRKKKMHEKGLLSLEASIALVIFIFLMLFLFSFFRLFEARNRMAHVLLQTTNSLAFDPLENEKLQNSGDLTELIVGLYAMFNRALGGESPFASKVLWNEILVSESNDAADGWRGEVYVKGSVTKNEDGSEEAIRHAAYSDKLETAVKDRFYAYLSGGNETEGDKILKSYHIENLSFVDTKISGGKLTVVITYDLKLEFDLFNIGKKTYRQSACSRLWK